MTTNLGIGLSLKNCPFVMLIKDKISAYPTLQDMAENIIYEVHKELNNPHKTIAWLNELIGVTKEEI